MTATIIDGKAFAATVREKVAAHVVRIKSAGVVPGLAVVLVGEDPASSVYVRAKGKQTVEVGMASFEHKLPADTSDACARQVIVAIMTSTRTPKATAREDARMTRGLFTV